MRLWKEAVKIRRAGNGKKSRRNRSNAGSAPHKLPLSESSSEVGVWRARRENRSRKNASGRRRARIEKTVRSDTNGLAKPAYLRMAQFLPKIGRPKSLSHQKEGPWLKSASRLGFDHRSTPIHHDWKSASIEIDPANRNELQINFNWASSRKRAATQRRVPLKNTLREHRSVLASWKGVQNRFAAKSLPSCRKSAHPCARRTGPALSN
ncbi:hypothetical protein [Pandoraea sp. PE-S2T-3]|uniref:hypothetical protein n=1 Tax=Pandoraea sp. PE-S2T-3 TaxID=1986993 RepID=UPI001124FAF7|nr:hypothetical protein [Pandoraea sp. PE-S2T-3]